MLKGHESRVMAVAFSPDNRWVVTGSWDSTARLWDLKVADPAAQPVVLKGHHRWVKAVAFSPDNHWVVTGSEDSTRGCGFYRLRICWRSPATPPVATYPRTSGRHSCPASHTSRSSPASRYLRNRRTFAEVARQLVSSFILRERAIHSPASTY